MYFVYAYIMLLERLTFVFPVSASSFFPEMRSHLAREVSLRKSQLRMTLQVWREEMSFKGRGDEFSKKLKNIPQTMNAAPFCVIFSAAYKCKICLYFIY